MAVVIANTKDMGRPEWLRNRKRGFGGSDISALFGLNKYKTPVELWEDKTDALSDTEEDLQSEAAYWGNELEEVVAKEFTKRTGIKVRRKNQLLAHDEHSFLLANIDRWIVGKNEGLECKTANAFLAKEWEGEDIPAAYLLQCQHYMLVTGAERWHIAVLIGGQKFITKPIERDEEIINAIIEQARYFWNEHVLKGIPPLLDGSSAAERYVKERYAKADPNKTISLYEQHENQLQTYLELKTQAKELETQYKAIENQIKSELKEAVVGLGSKFEVHWKPVTSNRVDSKELKALYPDIYEAVLKSSASRRFEIKEVK